MKQFCPQCNKWIDSSTRKCPNCGTIMYDENEYTQSAINDLRIDVGIIGIEGCSRDENKKYTEMLQNGQPLPDDLIKREYSDGTSSFLHTVTKIPPNEEEKYLLMRIFKDLHFIRMLLQTLLILSIIAAFLIPFILAVFN